MDTRQIRALWFAFAALTSACVGTAGGLLAHLAGDDTARAVIMGGGTFAGTLIMVLTALTFMLT